MRIQSTFGSLMSRKRSRSPFYHSPVAGSPIAHHGFTGFGGFEQSRPSSPDLIPELSADERSIPDSLDPHIPVPGSDREPSSPILVHGNSDNASQEDQERKLYMEQETQPFDNDDRKTGLVPFVFESLERPAKRQKTFVEIRRLRVQAQVDDFKAEIEHKFWLEELNQTWDQLCQLELQITGLEQTGLLAEKFHSRWKSSQECKALAFVQLSTTAQQEGKSMTWIGQLNVLPKIETKNVGLLESALDSLHRAVSFLDDLHLKPVQREEHKKFEFCDN